MLSNKETCFEFTAKQEGGYTDNAKDNGNWSGGIAGHGNLIGTIYGVSAPLLNHTYPGITADQVKQLPISVFSVAAQSYWDKVWGDRLPAGVDLMVFDFGYNAGPGRSIQLLQQAVLAAQDGIIGEGTMEAITEYLHPDAQRVCWVKKMFGTNANSNPKTPSDIVLALYDLQIAYYKAIPTFKVFGDGWVHRTNMRRDLALTMAQKAGLSS